jgi:hypothetical protein
MQYNIYPSEGSSSVLFILIIILITLILIAILFVFIGFFKSSKSSRVILNKDTLEIKAFIYSKKIPLNIIRKDKAVKVSLLKDESLKPKIKLNGIAIKGYHAGWFKLNDGSKAFLNITKEDEAVYIPANDYIILLSIQNADQFLRDLKK